MASWTHGINISQLLVYTVRQNNIQSLCKISSCRLYCCVNFWNCYVRHSTVSTGAIGTSIYTVYSRYNYIHRHCIYLIYIVCSRHNYLHCLQQVQLSSLSIVGTTIYTVNSRYNYLHCLQQVQPSTLSTVGTAVYTVCNRYSYLHCQWVKLSTLSTISTAIYTVYNMYSQLYLLQTVLLKFAEEVHPTNFSKIAGRLSHQNEKQQILHINYSIAQSYITNDDSSNFNSTRVFFAYSSVAIFVAALASRAIVAI